MDKIKSKLNLFFALVIFFGVFVFSSIIPNSLFTIHTANAATNISSTTAEHFAWNDNIGWIDFYSTNNVNVTASQLNSYASSSVGSVALDCATSPNGNICGTSNFKVANDGSGNLSGWAYNDAIGWISFDSATASSSYFYQVTVSPSTGDFSGWAWNDVAGWISFNCLNDSSCGTSDYKVKTSWTASQLEASLTSSIFDTNATSGVALNTIMWQGSQPSGTNVKFQIASSNSTSTWNYIGPDGSATTYYTPVGPGYPAQINLQHHNNKRYFQYKMFLYSNTAQTATPRVDDVIINYSP